MHRTHIAAYGVRVPFFPTEISQMQLRYWNRWTDIHIPLRGLGGFISRDVARAFRRQQWRDSIHGVRATQMALLRAEEEAVSTGRKGLDKRG